MRASSTGPRQSRGHGSGISSYATDVLVLPPLYQSKKSRSSVGLRQMKLPGGSADMWTAPQASLKPRSAQFRQWVAQTGSDLERDASAWDTSKEVKALNPKFKSAFKARTSVSSSRRPRSALSSIRAVYLGAAADSDDLASSIAAGMAEAASEAAASESSRLQQELAAIRTGDEAVLFFARHSANSKTKVLYCNQQDDETDAGSSACNLIVVPEHKLKPEHYTISANGVFHVCPGEMSECTPLSEWMHQGMMYAVLKSMPFFKFFTYQKNFQHWRTNARHEAYCRQREWLSRRCFLAKPMFVESLAKVHRLVTDVQELPLLLLNQDSQRLPDFMATQLEICSNPSTGARAQLERRQDLLLEVLGGLVEKVQQAFAQIPSSQEQSRNRSKSKSIVQEKQEAREQARKLQMVERDLASIKTFIQLADYMFQGARVGAVMDATVAFSRRLASGHRMFTVDAQFEQAGVVLSPACDEFSRKLSRLWDCAIQSVSLVPSLASSHQFRKYFAADHNHEQTVEEILDKSGTYRTEVEHIQKVIYDQLAVAEASANELYLRYHHIYKFGMQWDEDSFGTAGHSFESLAGQMALMSEFKGELVGFRLARAFGVIHVNGSGMRSALEPVPERAITVMMQLLASMAHEKCVLTSQKLSAAIRALEERPTTAQSIATYKGLCDAAEAHLEESVEVSADLEDAWRLLVKQGYRVTVDDQLQLDMMRARRHDLEQVKLPQARAYLLNLSSDLVVTIHASQRDVHDLSLACASTSGNGTNAQGMDLDEDVYDGGSKDVQVGELGRTYPSAPHPLLVQADGRRLTEESPSAEAPESIASVLRRQAAGASPTRGNTHL